MDFRYKVLMKNFMAHLPSGMANDLNYWCQKHITHSLPADYSTFDARYEDKVERHLLAFKSLLGGIPEVYFEFGTGWDLFAPIGFSIAGFKKLYCIDIEPVARLELINTTIQHYCRKNGIYYEGVASFRELLERFNIEYKAPCDAGMTRLPDASIDVVVSNVVLEQVPVVDVVRIMKEMFRIMKSSGLASFTINYADHYKYIDSSISSYNFLKYSAEEWEKYNSAWQYHNRLRHVDYARIISDAGFEIVTEESYLPDDVEALEMVPIHKEFQNYSLEELRPTFGWFVFKKS